MQVIVTVLDDNDHSPVFSQSSYTFHVPEDVNIDHLVGTVSASDNDEGINELISFIINADNSSEWCHFSNLQPFFVSVYDHWLFFFIIIIS